MARSSQRRLGRGLQSLLADPPEAPAEQSVGNVDHNLSSASIESRGGAVDVAVDQIQPNPTQPRRHFDEQSIRELTDSIETHGVLQPIILRPSSGGDARVAYEIIAGERRWRAAKQAGLTTIPSIIRTLDDQNTAELALIENIQREDLNPIDRALGFKHLIDHFGLTQAEVAERVGIDRSSVANLIRLTDLEPPIQQLIAESKLSAGHGKALLAASASEVRTNLAIRAARESWSVRALERAAKAAGKPRPPVERHPLTSEPTDPNTEAIAAQLGEHLDTRVRIHRSGRGGRIELVFFDNDHFDAVVQRMQFHYDS